MNNIVIVNNKRAISIFITFIIILITLSCCFIENGENGIKVLSIVSMVELLFFLLIWFFIYKELIAPIPIIIVCFFIFNLGQTFLWVFNFNHILDVKTSCEHSLETICKGLKYLMLCLNFFFLGLLLHKRKGQFVSTDEEKNNLNSSILKIACLLILLISVVPYFIYIYNMLINSLKNGYAYIYTDEYQSTTNTFLNIIANLFEPALLGLIVSLKKKGKGRAFCIILCIFIVGLKFLIGGRSSGVTMIIAILLIYYFDNKKISLSQIIGLVFLAIILLTLISVTQNIRTMSSRTISDYFDAARNSDSIITSIFGEFGWSISPTLYTMELVPNNYSFRWGYTYFISLLSIIPNIGFWEVHPAEKYASLTNWVTRAANHTWSGVGYSSTAEAYINFSWFGCLIFIIWGLLIAKVIISFKDSTKKSPISMFCISSCFLCLFYSFIRGDFRDMVRAFSWRILPILILFLFVKSILQTKVGKNEKNKAVN